MDVFSEEKRSEIMRLVKGRDTSPEILVRKIIFKMGYRYRLHSSNLPGKPDIVFPGKKKVLFVHGCFWHGHDCRAGQNTPSSNTKYWNSKLERNRERDKAVQTELNSLGWEYSIIWECELKKIDQMAMKIKKFLDSAPRA